MKPQLFENYRFERQDLIEEFRRLSDAEMIKIPQNLGTQSVFTKFQFLDKKIETIKLPSFLDTGITAAGFVEVQHNSTIIGRLFPWSYSKNYNLSKVFPSSDETVEQLSRQGLKVKKCGTFYHFDGNKTTIRWRHFFSPSSTEYDYAVQYEFECTLYASGMIEFFYPSRESIFTHKNYSPLENENNAASTGARFFNAGVYVPPLQNGVQVVDFSINKNFSIEDQFLGGYRIKESTITRTRAAFDHNLKYSDWPSTGKFGTIYRLIPPPKEIKKILPRKTVKKQYSENLINGTIFDDRKSLNFDQTFTVSMPSALPHLYGQGTTFKIHDFFNESDINLSRKVSPRDITNPKENETKTVSPFNELNSFELDIRESEFYQTGTLMSEVGPGFEGGLHQKTKICYELPIENKSALPGKQSSFFIYDTQKKVFLGMTGSLPDSTNPDKLWVNLFGDAKLFSAFGAQTFSVTQENSSSPKRLFPSDWENKKNLREMLNTARHYDSEFHVNRRSVPEIDFEGQEFPGIVPLTFNNEFSSPFLLEKINIEIPIEAGPGWFNDRTIAFNYGSEIDPNYVKHDAGGPCVTLGLIKESKNIKAIKKGYKYENETIPQFVNREVIASCALIPTGDVRKGFFYCDYDISRYVDEESTALNVQLIPTGFNFYSRVNSFSISPNETNQFSGTVKLNFTPQNVSNFYYTRTSNKKEDDPRLIYDYGRATINLYENDDNNLIKLENFKLPTQSGVALSDNRNVLKAIPIFFNEKIEESPWNSFDKEQISIGFKQIIQQWQSDDNLIKPPVHFQEAEPLLFSKNYVENNKIHILGGLDGDPKIDYLDSAQSATEPDGGYPANSWSSGVDNLNNTKQFRNLGVSNAGMIITQSDNPYLLMPGDKLGIFISKYRPALKKINSKLGGWVEFFVPNGVCSEHDFKISTGKIRIILHGSYIKEGKEWNLSTRNNSDCVERSVTVGDEPVLDQFEIEHDLETLGCHHDNWLFPVNNTLFSKTTLKTSANFDDTRMRLFGSSYGKLQADYRDSNNSIDNKD